MTLISNNFQKHLMLEIRDYLMIATGTLLYGFAVVLFMLPYGLTSGGVSGVATIFFYITGIEVQNTYLVINIALLLAAIKVLGFRFCVKTIWGVLTTSFWMWLWQRIGPQNPDGTLLQIAGENQQFLASVVGGVFEGIGLFFCFSNNGSTGGTDIIAAIVNKYKNVSLGQVIMFCDLVIISSCYFIFHDWQRVVFGYVMLFLSGMTLDYITSRSRQSVQFLVFSRSYAAIADAINASGRGVTVLDGIGWWTKSKRKVVVVLAKKREQEHITRIVKNIDPFAFMSITLASGVVGEGFEPFVDKEKRKNTKRRTIVFASFDEIRVAEFRAMLGTDVFDVRSLRDIGASDTNEQINEHLKSSNAILQANCVKRYYGFDCVAHGMGNISDEENASPVFAFIEGDYESANYTVHTFNFVPQLKDYLDHQLNNAAKK